MPAPFDRCVKAGGRVRTKKLSGGRYIHICFLDGKSYAGEVKTKGESVKFIKIPVCEFRVPEKGILEKVTEYSFDSDLFTEEQAKKWIKKAISPKTKGDFGAWCKRQGFGGVNQACINKAAKTGGRAAKMALFAVNVSKGKYSYPKAKK